MMLAQIIGHMCLLVVLIGYGVVGSKVETVLVANRITVGMGYGDSNSTLLFKRSEPLLYQQWEKRNNDKECQRLHSVYGRGNRWGGPSNQFGQESNNIFCGDVTFYDTGLGACGKINRSTDYIAAINHHQFGNIGNPNNSPMCNRCAKIRGGDPAKPSIKVRIVDKCEGCKYGDLDLSLSAFRSLYETHVGRARIMWEYCEC
ncbi:hypothetical protein BB561_005839 [Smittium simulii]|uniref:RlpA-like protein double-psi beta-barrel domain-containing protein n=1 Tax=Smittium simulii TaxID=133385 RepID=A0A2T9Y806_9FUNG|nr:hypothetical protein BB561_005839 [Smittium simulii]